MIDVEHVAKLANLKLTKTEIEKFSQQLSEVLGYISQLEEVNVDNIEPTGQVTGLVNVKRDDESTPALSSEEVLANAPTKNDSLFKVKAVFEDED
jgi:aspartyl-tRNA(Asn)/glutamyl-tRNA(Gln) amidotransferase subunit C